jgi:hypothetical protein
MLFIMISILCTSERESNPLAIEEEIFDAEPIVPLTVCFNKLPVPEISPNPPSTGPSTNPNNIFKWI